MKLVIPLCFISRKESFSDISRKRTLPNMVLLSNLIKWTFLPQSENESFHEIKHNRMTSFTVFMHIIHHEAKANRGTFETCFAFHNNAWISITHCQATNPHYLTTINIKTRIQPHNNSLLLAISSIHVKV